MKLVLTLTSLFLCSLLNSQIVFTELLVRGNPPTGGRDSLEFIELYNNSPNTVNLLGWSLYLGTFNNLGIPIRLGNINIQPREYLVLAPYPTAINRYFGASAVSLPSSYSINDMISTIVLRNNNALTVDSVFYYSLPPTPWPPSFANRGISLALCDPNLDNSSHINWQLSASNTGLFMNGVEVKGSPGTSDRVCLPVVRFNTTFDSIPEPNGPAQVQINIINPDPTQSYSVDVVSTNSGNSINGQDYIFSSPYTVNFPIGGPYVAFVPIAIVDDTDGETFVETADFALINPSSNLRIGQSRFTLNIIDNDSPPLQAISGLIITEINYNPVGNIDSLEFVEVYNNSGNIINLDGAKFTRGINLVIPPDIMQPGEYRIFAANSACINRQFGKPSVEYAATESLSNTGEAIVIRDAFNNVVDSVSYGTSGTWPTSANGAGRSLVFCNYTLDNNIGGNWTISTLYTGLSSNNNSGTSTFPNVDIFCSPASNDNTCVPQTGTKVTFSIRDNFVNENAGNALVRLKISGTLPNQPTTVILSLSPVNNGSASPTNGTDYIFANNLTVTFPANDSSDILVTIPIVDDTLIEGNESFRLNLFAITPGTRISPNNFQDIFILENDFWNGTGVVITEINLNNLGPFIELHNSNYFDVNLIGGDITFGTTITRFNTNTIVPANGYLIIAGSTSRPPSFSCVQVVLSVSLGVPSLARFPIQIRDANLRILDSLTFYPRSPRWQPAANGDIRSAVLCDYSSDNSLPSNWQPSGETRPLYFNGTYVYCSHCLQDLACPTSPIEESTKEPEISIFPNPSPGNINVSGTKNGDIIKIYDILGRERVSALSIDEAINITLEKGLFICVVIRDGHLFNQQKIIIE